MRFESGCIRTGLYPRPEAANPLGQAGNNTEDGNRLTIHTVDSRGHRDRMVAAVSRQSPRKFKPRSVSADSGAPRKSPACVTFSPPTLGLTITRPDAVRQRRNGHVPETTSIFIGGDGFFEKIADRGPSSTLVGADGDRTPGVTSADNGFYRIHPAHVYHHGLASDPGKSSRSCHPWRRDSMGHFNDRKTVDLVGGEWVSKYMRDLAKLITTPWYGSLKGA